VRRDVIIIHPFALIDQSTRYNESGIGYCPCCACCGIARLVAAALTQSTRNVGRAAVIRWRGTEGFSEEDLIMGRRRQTAMSLPRNGFIPL